MSKKIVKCERERRREKGRRNWRNRRNRRNAWAQLAVTKEWARPRWLGIGLGCLYDEHLACSNRTCSSDRVRSLDQPALTSLNQPGRSHGRLCFQALIPGAVCVPMHPMKCKNINKTTPFATPTAQLSHHGHALAAYGVETGHPINAGEIQGLKLISLGAAFAGPPTKWLVGERKKLSWTVRRWQSPGYSIYFHHYCISWH